MTYEYRLTTDGRGEYRIECKLEGDDTLPWFSLVSGFRDLEEARAALEERRHQESGDWKVIE